MGDIWSLVKNKHNFSLFTLLNFLGWIVMLVLLISLFLFFFLWSTLWTYLWQNFLTDSNIRHWISGKTEHLYTLLGATSLIEIWPGKWAITKLIKDISPDFLVIEKDEKMLTGLEEILWWKAQIIMNDVLHTDIVSEKTHLFIVGNLPYYITSPILRKFFAPESHVLWGLFMIQAEVGEKITFEAKKKSYLYRLLNYGYKVEYLKTVAPKSFTPPPKVYSCLISLKKKEKTEIPQISFTILKDFLDLIAVYPRKTLGAITKLLEKHPATPVLTHVLDFLHRGNVSILKKRLEELSREELSSLLMSSSP